MKKKTSGSFETWVEIPITVHYDASPEQKMTWDYPGYPAQVDITAMEFKGIELKCGLIDLNEVSVSHELADYILKKYQDSMIEECWEDVE